MVCHSGLSGTFPMVRWMERALYFLDELKVELAIRRFRALDVNDSKLILMSFGIKQDQPRFSN